MQNVLKGLQIARDIPYREPDALFALGGADGMGKSVYLPVGESLLNRHMLLVGGAATGKNQHAAAYGARPAHQYDRE